MHLKGDAAWKLLADICKPPPPVFAAFARLEFAETVDHGFQSVNVLYKTVSEMNGNNGLLRGVAVLWLSLSLDLLEVTLPARARVLI
jgi:hypothetical protein